MAISISVIVGTRKIDLSSRLHCSRLTVVIEKDRRKVRQIERRDLQAVARRAPVPVNGATSATGAALTAHY